MKQLLDGTLALMLASFVFAAPQAPAAESGQPGKTADKHARGGKRASRKGGKQSGSAHGKTSKAPPATGQPVGN